MADTKYPNPATRGVVGKVVRERPQRLEEAEAEALGSAPTASPEDRMKKVPDAGEGYRTKRRKEE